MQLSVIILNYNVRYFLELCVLSVQKAIGNLDAEIIVVDNASADDSCSMMQERFPDVKFIRNTENVGFPKGNNVGVKQAKGEYICILNPDTVVAEDTFEKILAFAEKQNDLGIVGCKLIDGTGNFLPECKRGVPTPWVAFTKIFGLYKFFPKSSLFNKYYSQHLGENQTGKVDILVGAFMVMKKELYEAVGGFDENCFMYSDDIDLSYLVLQQRKSNYYFHETSVIHYKGESTVRDGTYMKRFMEAMNFFYKKHFKTSVFFSVFMKIGMLFFAGFKMFQGKTKPVFKPEMYVLFSENETLKARIETVLKQPVIMKNSLELETVSADGKRAEWIFDNNAISFKSIINCLEKHKNKGLTFKILPAGSNYSIGSNNRNDRGEVVKL